MYKYQLDKTLVYFLILTIISSSVAYFLINRAYSDAFEMENTLYVTR